MGIGPVMPWRVARPDLVWKRIHLPLQVALAAGALTILTTTRISLVVSTVMISVFVVAVIVRHLLAQASQAASVKGTGIASEARRIVRRDPGYWGGQVSHTGVALLAVGIAFATVLSVHNQVTMEPGDTVEFDGYEVTYLTPFVYSEPNRLVEGATIELSADGELVTELRPRFNQYPNFGQLVGTPEVYSDLSGDIYLTLRRLDATGIVLQLDSSPLQWLVWLGGLVTVAGGFISMRGRRSKAAEEREAIGV